MRVTEGRPASCLFADLQPASCFELPFSQPLDGLSIRLRKQHLVPADTCVNVSDRNEG
jgi:hypothetical protein